MPREPETTRWPETSRQWKRLTTNLSWLVRWYLARWMIHAALKMAPAGQAKDELSNLFWTWGDHVREVVNGRR